MRRILLDTSAYSAFFRGHAKVLEAVQMAAEIYLNPIVLGELHSGFLKGSRAESNRNTLTEFLASTRVATLPIDDETSVRYAIILHGLRRAGTPIPTNDIWIAASAMQHGLFVVTNGAHFDKVPQIGTVVFTG